MNKADKKVEEYFKRACKLMEITSKQANNSYRHSRCALEIAKMIQREETK